MEMELFDDLTDDEDFLELLGQVSSPRAPRNFRERPNHFEKWNDNELRERFRLSKQTVHGIINLNRERLTCLKNLTLATTPEEMILVTLRYLATGCILQVIGDFCGIDKGTASRIIIKVVRYIAQQGKEIINMPSNQREAEKVKEGFYQIARFPKCIGAIDCTHVRIVSPGGEQAEIFRNRKGYFSTNVQAICDSKLHIQDIVCRWPGSAHHSTIFNNSRIKARIENGEFGIDSLLVADSGYPIKNYMITPLTNPVDPERLFNHSQTRTRNPIERCFGVLKTRFPVLALGIRLHISKVEAIVVACTVLHNIACTLGEPEPTVNEEISEAIRQTMNININDYPDNLPHGYNVNNVVRLNLITRYFDNLQ